MSTDIHQLISKAKIKLMQQKDSMFFATLCCNLVYKFIEEIPTAGTDGISLYINPDFFLNLSESQRVFLLAHETLHVAYLHAFRGKDYDHELFNCAADYVINAELKERGYEFIPDVLYDRKYQGLSTEQVYKLLEEQPHKPQLKYPDLQMNTESAEDAAQAESKVIQAALSSEMSGNAGSIPGDIRRMIESIKKPAVNWRAVLQRFLTELNPEDYSWKRPNKRYLPTYLPRLHSNVLGRVDFAIDTSGSVSEKLFTQFISELHSVFRMANPKEIGIIQFDHCVQNVTTVKSVKALKDIPLIGGGGTNVHPVFEEFKTSKAQALFFITDGFFYTSGLEKPKRPVFWVIYNNPKFQAPFGQAIHISLKE